MRGRASHVLPLEGTTEHKGQKTQDDGPEVPFMHQSTCSYRAPPVYTLETSTNLPPAESHSPNRKEVTPQIQ